MTMDLGEGHERVTLEGNPTSIRKYSISVFDSTSLPLPSSPSRRSNRRANSSFIPFIPFIYIVLRSKAGHDGAMNDDARREETRTRDVTASSGGTTVVVRTDHPSERKVAPPKANLIVNLGVHRKLRNSLAA